MNVASMGMPWRARMLAAPKWVDWFQQNDWIAGLGIVAVLGGLGSCQSVLLGRERLGRSRLQLQVDSLKRRNERERPGVNQFSLDGTETAG